MEAVSEAIKASGDPGVKRKFSDLFQRLDGVATIDGRSFEGSTLYLDFSISPLYFESTMFHSYIPIIHAMSTNE